VKFKPISSEEFWQIKASEERRKQLAQE